MIVHNKYAGGREKITMELIRLNSVVIVLIIK